MPDAAMDKSPKKIYFAADAHLGARFHQDPAGVEKKLSVGQ
jgi:UDP-2,3-diacylglucosamine hydrolase